MEIFETCKDCIILSILLTFLSSSLVTTRALLPAADQQEFAAPLPSNENMPVLASPPSIPAIVNANGPVGKPQSNQGKHSQLGYQEQQDLNYSQHSFTPPFSFLSQPYSGFNKPFSGLNPPFGANNQQGLVANSPFGSGVSGKRISILGVVLVSLITLMATF